MVTHLEYSLSFSFFFLLCCARRPQDFPLLRLDDIVDDQSNIVGFSMFNTTHPFYLEFIRSLNLSWREGCDLTYPGPAVSQADGGGGGGLGEGVLGGRWPSCISVSACSGNNFQSFVSVPRNIKLFYCSL